MIKIVLESDNRKQTVMINAHGDIMDVATDFGMLIERLIIGMVTQLPKDVQAPAKRLFINAVEMAVNECKKGDES